MVLVSNDSVISIMGGMPHRNKSPMMFMLGSGSGVAGKLERGETPL